MQLNPTHSAPEIAGILDISERRLQQLVKEGVIPKPATRGRYDLVEAVRGYVTFWRNKAEKRQPGYAYEKERLTRLQGDMVEANLRAFDDRYLLKDQVNERWTHWCVLIRKHILNSTMTEDEKHDTLQNLHDELVAQLTE